jgi:hypothetical protein
VFEMAAARRTTSSVRWRWPISPLHRGARLFQGAV